MQAMVTLTTEESLRLIAKSIVEKKCVKYAHENASGSFLGWISQPIEIKPYFYRNNLNCIRLSFRLQLQTP